jgi:SAM-dependent methyltransferase
MDGQDVFDREARAYDAWYDSPDGRVIFANELAAVRLLWRGEYRPALEVGVGSGRFAQALGIGHGIDPAVGALAMAARRGVGVVQARGEALPFSSGGHGGVLMVATVCFAESPEGVLAEAARVLRPAGCLILCAIPADSPWGELYSLRKSAGHPFYRFATFYTVAQLLVMVGHAGLVVDGHASTLVNPPSDPARPETAQPELVTGAGFVCLRARRR